MKPHQRDRQLLCLTELITLIDIMYRNLLRPTSYASRRALATQPGPHPRAPPARTTPSPPKDQPEYDEPSLGSSELLLGTAEAALATPGLTFTDGHGLRGAHGKGRETRRMNLHQAIRDALG